MTHHGFYTGYSKLIRFEKHGRIPTGDAVHVFRFLHPEITFADVTLRRLLTKYDTEKGVVDHWNNVRPRRKRGVRGVRCVPDAAIVRRYVDLPLTFEETRP